MLLSWLLCTLLLEESCGASDDEVDQWLLPATELDESWMEPEPWLEPTRLSEE